jgi:hypothetical protein
MSLSETSFKVKVIIRGVSDVCQSISPPLPISYSETSRTLRGMCTTGFTASAFVNCRWQHTARVDQLTRKAIQLTSRSSNRLRGTPPAAPRIVTTVH